MIYLIISIICVAGLFISFKVMDKYPITLSVSIFISYAVSILFSLTGITNGLQPAILTSKWLWFAAFTSGFFIFNFFMIGLCTKRLGIAVTSVANKLSLIIPVTLSMLIDPLDTPDIQKLSAIALSLVAIVLILYPSGKTGFTLKDIWLAVALFVGVGTADASLKYAQQKLLGPDELSLFVTCVFIFCFIYSTIVFIWQKTPVKEFSNRYNWITGLLLGVTNWAAFITLMMALDHVRANGTTMRGSVLFGINNLGIVSISVLAGFIIFKEKISALNITGILTAVATILLLTFFAL